MVCKNLNKCKLAKSLAEMAIEDKIDPDIIEAVDRCGKLSVKDVLRISRKLNITNSMDRFLLGVIKKVDPDAVKLSSYNEGYVIGIGDFLLIINNEPNDELTNDAINISLSYKLLNKLNTDECSIVIDRVSNEYVNYLVQIVRNVVPNSDYSLSSLISVRDQFLSLFIDDKKYRLATLLASLNLGGLTPLLLDKDIEDIYITQDSVYVNHIKYGTCVVLNINSQVIARQLLRLANISGVRVSTDNPSGKFAIDIAGRRLRITVDRWPLVEGIAVHIRLHKRPFTISNLISTNALNITDASKLILSLRNEYNVLIIGPPSSGKTTLLNALDMAIPLNLRRIYIDEADESLELPTPSVKVRSIIGKAEEVLKSLHRGYGILIIGELREKEHFEALVHGVNAGLQVLATTHADSIQSLINRLRIFSLDNIIDLSKYIIIIMERANTERRVKTIVYPQDLMFNQDQLNIISNIIIKLRKIYNYVDYAIKLNYELNSMFVNNYEH
jgi:flagellar protein FlaI